LVAQRDQVLDSTIKSRSAPGQKTTPDTLIEVENVHAVVVQPRDSLYCNMVLLKRHDGPYVTHLCARSDRLVDSVVSTDTSNQCHVFSGVHCCAHH